MLKQNLIELKLSQKRVKEESQLLFPLIPKTNGVFGQSTIGIITGVLTIERLE